jgi:predicted RNA-binding protein YlxR (DUF448 family)
MSKVAEAPRSGIKSNRRNPQRTCVSCHTTTSKRDLVRIARTPEGRVVPDSSSKAPGRGAYLCTNQNCWESALKTGVLGRALRTTITEADAKQVAEYGHDICEGEAS